MTHNEWRKFCFEFTHGETETETDEIKFYVDWEDFFTEEDINPDDPYKVNFYR